MGWWALFTATRFIDSPVKKPDDFVKMTSVIFKLNAMETIFIILIALIIQFPPEGSTSASDQCQPVEVVQAFCSLDSAGARCHSGQLDTLSVLYDLRGEPGWDQSMVIDGYGLVQSHHSGDSAIVTVRYDIVGWLAGADLYLPGDKPFDSKPPVPEEELVNFKLDKFNGCWRIRGMNLMPHTSVANTVSRIDRALSNSEGIDLSTLHTSVAEYIRGLKESRKLLIKYQKGKREN